jgi:Ring finger domain
MKRALTCNIAVMAAWLLWAASISTNLATNVAAADAGQPFHLSIRRRRQLQVQDVAIANETIVNEESAAPTAAPSVRQTPAPTTTPNAGGYELVIFMLWYIFLVACCVIPAFCAYRRRRWQELRQARERGSAVSPVRDASSLAWMQASPASFEALVQGAFLHKYNSPAERTKRLQAALAATSRTLTTDDFVAGDSSVELVKSSRSLARLESEDFDQISSWVRLPAGNVTNSEAGTETASRLVPGVCSICLCAYQVGESVSWSSSSSSATTCTHAFHSDCIVAWLAKKDAAASCPVCRQEFCAPALWLVPPPPPTTIPITTEPPSPAATTTTTARDVATTTSQTILFYPSTMQHGAVNITEEHRQ